MAPTLLMRFLFVAVMRLLRSFSLFPVLGARSLRCIMHVLTPFGLLRFAKMDRYLYDNNLDGPIPSELGKLTALTRL